MIPHRYSHLARDSFNPGAFAASANFVADLWDYSSPAFTFIGTRIGERWRDHPIQGQDRRDQVEAILAAHPPARFDIYFCPNAFTEPRRLAKFALPSRYAWCDIDGAEPTGYDPRPNILWQTSPGRFQGIWIWDRAFPPASASQYSRSLVYKDGGDKTGWSITKMLRLPGTINHKRAYAKPLVLMTAYDHRPKKLPRSLLAPSSRRLALPSDVGTIRSDAVDPYEVLARYRSRVSLFARTLLLARRVIYPDRSEAIFVIVSELVNAGANDGEIAAVLLINPHFLDKHGADAAMAQRETLCIRAKTEVAR